MKGEGGIAWVGERDLLEREIVGHQGSKSLGTQTKRGLNGDLQPVAATVLPTHGSEWT